MYTRAIITYKWLCPVKISGSWAAGSLSSSVYFPSMDTLALMGLQVTPEVRAGGTGRPPQNSASVSPSACNFRASSPRTAAENAS